jgi:hypothetical protein
MPEIKHHHTARHDGEKTIIHHHVPEGMVLKERTSVRNGVRHLHFVIEKQEKQSRLDSEQ